MRPKERRDTGQGDLLRSRLDAVIDMEHALVRLARTIDWSFLEERFGAVYEDKPGPAAAADAADGGLGHPQAHLRPLR
jgi:transposase, IS5 family